MHLPENIPLGVPDAEAAERFFGQLSERHKKHAQRLKQDAALFSDVLTLASYSPLLAATLLQQPEYIGWLSRKRTSPAVRDKETLLESLARFALTNSTVDTNILLARFRRRELLRIYLMDIRRLATIAEITEEISNLADAILEYSLRLSRQELDNRYGQPEELDEKGRLRAVQFCVVSLGKLGSLELNYASDIDLLFIYSAEGKTTGTGTRGVVTNREYFVKLAETITKTVGGNAGEGAAYRVDLRLRPHGRVGSLALPVADTIRYYKTEARGWERQVLIRSRSSAGDANVYKQFFASVEDFIFSTKITVEKALSNVRLSKEKIDSELTTAGGFNVKLGSGGIREIEFIAQALQIAHGGNDPWLRASHTLKSLSRLADRSLISERELTELFDAYTFLRQLEHILQMEHGLQTHTVPNDQERRTAAARRMRFDGSAELTAELIRHTENVGRTFTRVFGTADHPPIALAEPFTEPPDNDPNFAPEPFAELSAVAKPSRRFREFLAAHFDRMDAAEIFADEFPERDYHAGLVSAVENATDLSEKLGTLRRKWSYFFSEIVIHDLWRPANIKVIKRLQADLAEAAIEAALIIVRSELQTKYSIRLAEFPLAVMGLGKLGGAGIDYDSDLDLVMVYGDDLPSDVRVTAPEFYTRAVEIFVNAISAMTRHGNLYRVDLRLRPHGKNGAAAISRTAFRDYIRTESAIWELLAYLKLRAVSGDLSLGNEIETEIRKVILARAANIEPEKLAVETQHVRRQLRENKTGFLDRRDVDIKFGEGGMLDIYFAVRYLQLRDGIPDSPEARSTDEMLNLLREKGSLGSDTHSALIEGYNFLSALDHNLRLIVGRTTKLPAADTDSLAVIAERMHHTSINDMLGGLAHHRIAVSEAFLAVIKS